MRLSRRSFIALGAAALLLVGARAQGAAVLPFSTPSPGAPLPGWLEPVTFGGNAKPNAFALVAGEGRTVLRVRSEASASGLARKLRVDPATHPLLSWRWKASRLVAKGRLAAKEGDDFALRLYLTFDLDPAVLSFGDRMKLSLARGIWGDHLPIAALCYVWDGSAATGTIAPNAFTDRVRMVVADSGPAQVGKWVAHARDVDADFRAAFGLQAPAVTSVILSADTDNTGESVESWFGDVAFSAR